MTERNPNFLWKVFFFPAYREAVWAELASPATGVYYLLSFTWHTECREAGRLSVNTSLNRAGIWKLPFIMMASGIKWYLGHSLKVRLKSWVEDVFGLILKLLHPSSWELLPFMLLCANLRISESFHLIKIEFWFNVESHSRWWSYFKVCLGFFFFL